MCSYKQFGSVSLGRSKYKGTFSVNSTSLAMRQFVTGIWHSSAAGAIILLILLPSGAQQAQNYGETCLSDIECVDHRMLCEARVTDSSDKRCYCNRFYIWDEELKQCSQIYNNTIELTSNYEEQDNNKLHSMSEHKMFITMSIIGLIAVISICTFLLSCTAYGCCSCTRIRDQKTNPPAVSCPPTCPLHSVPLLQQDKPLVEQDIGMMFFKTWNSNPLYSCADSQNVPED